MPTRPRPGAAVATLGLGLLLAACGASAPASSLPAAPSVSPAPSQPAAAPLLTALDLTPQQVKQAAIQVAFATDTADALVTDLPADFDFGSRALLCVYLGERPTSGWKLTLQSATLGDGTLHVLAREQRPGGGGGQAVTTYPAGCGALDRAALPEGRLAVRADDTISDEFITDGTLVVPPAAGAP